jgi:hypothetical protein
VGRIEGIEPAKAGLFTRIAYWLAKKKVGEVPAPLTIYAHNPWVMRAYGAFEMTMQRASRAPPRLKALASIKAGTLVGCPW